MIKRVLILTTILLLVGSWTVYFLKESTTAILVEPIKIDKKVDDFIVHLRVENYDGGMQILRSIEYIGTETITLSHRTPLIGFSIDNANPDFTGSPVTKVMDPGDIYHPEDPEYLAFLNQGTYTLYVHCQFKVDGETIDIKSEHELIFE